MSSEWWAPGCTSAAGLGAGCALPCGDSPGWVLYVHRWFLEGSSQGPLCGPLPRALVRTATCRPPPPRPVVPLPWLSRLDGSWRPRPLERTQPSVAPFAKTTVADTRDVQSPHCPHETERGPKKRGGMSELFNGRSSLLNATSEAQVVPKWENGAFTIGRPQSRSRPAVAPDPSPPQGRQH